MIGAYDPAGGAYAFSPIGFNGQLLAGLGATEDARWDNSFKYRVTYGPVHAGAMYKFADGSGGCNYTGTLTAPKNTTQQCFAPNNDAAQFNLGGVYGDLNVDAVAGYYHQATIMAGGNAPLSSAQLTNSTFTPTSGRRRHLDRQQSQHAERHHYRHRRRGDRGEIHMDTVQVFRRLRLRKPEQSA